VNLDLQFAAMTVCGACGTANREGRRFCAQCGAAITLRSFQQAVTVVCESCHSILDAKDPALTVLQQFKAATNETRPLIPLGARGKLRGTDYEVIGFQRRTIFVDGVPDLLRLVLAGIYSAVIGLVPACLFTAIPVHAPRRELVGAATGLLMQVSNFGALVGPPITAALVSRGGWPAAAWTTSIALGIAALAGVFLHWRERRKLAS